MMRRLTILPGLLGVLGVFASTLGSAGAEENIATLRNAPIAGAPTDEESLFRAGSLSQQMITLGILQLVEAGERPDCHRADQG